MVAAILCTVEACAGVRVFETVVLVSAEQQAAPLSNDDLLYDPEMDDDDESWINRQRQSYQPAAARHAADADAGGATRRLPNSDAVLNCPACMSLLCLDCQRSVLASTQCTPPSF